MTGFGDVRDVLVRLPRNPWGGYGGSYVESDIFPTKHRVLRELVPGARSVFEFGALHGFFLVTALEACPQIRQVAWCDLEVDVPGSNVECAENIVAWAKASEEGVEIIGPPRARATVLSMPHSRGRVAVQWCKWTRQSRSWPMPLHSDIVHVDGEHTYRGCLIDLALAHTMHPKVILVDDTTAIEDVRTAVEDFCLYMGYEVEYHATVNGFAVLTQKGR